MKINLDAKSWEDFAVKCLKETIKRNKDNNLGYVFTFNYDYDEVEICTNVILDGMLRNLLSAITISKIEYDAGTAKDEVIINNLFGSLLKNAKRR